MRVTISALPKTRHLPVRDFLPDATEYTKALELNERYESSAQPRDAIQGHRKRWTGFETPIT